MVSLSKVIQGRHRLADFKSFIMTFLIEQEILLSKGEKYKKEDNKSSKKEGKKLNNTIK